MSDDFQLEDTLHLPFTTRAFATGIPTVLAGTPAIDIYEDVTAAPIITGETLAVSLNSVAGFNMITVTATAGTGFEAGKSYTAIIQAGTVDGVSVVGEVVAHFTIDKSAAAKDLANGTDGLGALSADIGAIPTTAMRGTDNAALASVATETRLAELDPANLPADIDSIGTRLPAALVSGRMSSDMVALSGSTNAADRLEASAETIVLGTATGVPTSVTMPAAGLTEDTNDHFNGRILIWTSGVLFQQATDILDYDGPSRTFTFTATTEAATAGDTFVVV